jgi:hypothetical protein
MNSVLVKDFVCLFQDITHHCFVAQVHKKNVSVTKRITLKINSIKNLLIKIAFTASIFLILLVREPLTLISQFALRRDGGLSGSYQFHRLWEIRNLLRKEKILSGIEFGSGASTIIFAKYITNFVSIEESADWRTHYLKNLKFLKFFNTDLYRRVEDSILVAIRREFLDNNGELVCSYELPENISQHFYELAYVDGPTNWIQSDLESGAYVRDPLRLLPNVSIFELSTLPRIILVDGRRSTVSYILSMERMLNYSLALKGQYFSPQKFLNYHSLFRDKSF